MRTNAKNKTNKLNNVVKCTNCFKSVSVPSRMAIYTFLTGEDNDEGNEDNHTPREATVTEVVEEIGLTQPTISYHLREMKQNGLLKSKKVGKEVFYSINKMCPHHNQECVLHGLNFPRVQEARV